MRRKLFLAVLICGAALIAAVGSAAPWDADEPGPGPGMERLACLELTPEQTRRVRTLQAELARAVNSLRIQTFERRAELRLLWMQMSPDEKAIEAKQGEIHDLRWNILTRETDFWLRVRKELTPEQLSRFLLQAGGPERSERHDRRPPPRPGRRPPPAGKW